MGALDAPTLLAAAPSVLDEDLLLFHGDLRGRRGTGEDQEDGQQMPGHEDWTAGGRRRYA